MKTWTREAIRSAIDAAGGVAAGAEAAGLSHHGHLSNALNDARDGRDRLSFRRVRELWDWAGRHGELRDWVAVLCSADTLADYDATMREAV